MEQNGKYSPPDPLQIKGSTSDEILEHRKKFYAVLRDFLADHPASPKLVVGLMAEATGYAIAQSPVDKRLGFQGYAHETLDKALAQQSED